MSTGVVSVKPEETYAGIGPLAQSAAQLELDAVPEAVRLHAARVIADTVGVMISGGQADEIAGFAALSDTGLDPTRNGVAQLVTPGLRRSDATTAAFINATAGTFLELDEGMRPTGHPAVQVLPAALATAQAMGRSGKHLLTAFLAGYEVSARLFEAYRLQFPTHPHGNLASVGAAVAVSCLIGTDPVSPALIAASLPLLATWQPAFEGATVRNTYAGIAAATGVLSNRLAAAGFIGSATAQDAAMGDLVGERADLDRLRAPVDPDDLAITRNYFKLYSACALCHTAIEAILQLGPFHGDEIRRIRVATVSNNLKVARQPEWHDLSTRFSLPYAVAAAAITGHANPDAFTPNAEVFRLARRVEVYGDQSLDKAWPTEAPATVTVELATRTVTATVANPRGHHSRPSEPDVLREKYERLVGSSVYRSSSYMDLLQLETMDSVANLVWPGP